MARNVFHANESLDTLFERLRTLLSLVQTEQLAFLAAALAYYAFLSVVPLFIVGFTVTSALAGETVATQILTATEAFLTPEAGELLTETLVTGPGRGGLTLAGSLVLVWGSLRVFRGLDIAFSRLYGNTRPKPLFHQLRDAVVVLTAIALAVAATVAISTISALFGVSLPGVLGPLGLLVVLPVVFFPLYYVFPARDVTVREAVPGALLAATGWTALGVLFGVYTSYAGSFQLYGVLGGVLLLLVWFYFGGVVLLLGVALNAVVAGRFGDRQLQQVSLRQGKQRATMREADGPTDDEPSDDSAPAHDAGTEDGTDTGEPNDERGEEREPGDAEHPTAGGPTSRAQQQRGVVTRDELRDLQRELDSLEAEIDDRTVHRTQLERDLKQYVRTRVRRGHATGWGPYLVLLYGTAMTLGAFYLLDGGWAVLAMLVIWLSTLGLYVLMLLVGVTLSAVGVPGRILNRVRNLR